MALGEMEREMATEKELKPLKGYSYRQQESVVMIDMNTTIVPQKDHNVLVVEKQITESSTPSI